MNAILHWFAAPEWLQVIKTLLHSLWQGVVIAGLLALPLRRVINPHWRYRFALLALTMIPVSGIITWAALNSAQPPLPNRVAQPLPIETTPTVTRNANPQAKVIIFANHSPADRSSSWTAWVALLWIAGSGAMLGRAGIKLAGAERLRQSSRPLDHPQVTQLFAEARRAIGMARRIRLAVTDKLTSPAVAGVLVPTLILPLSLVTTLTPEQIRFILLHELAHIRRGDYFANLFQLFIEAVLFFNPAVWWIGHQVRREREACCDALAIELSGAPADYARTLVHVAENILNTATAAPAFGDERAASSLADRVQRLLVPGYRPSLRLTSRAIIAAFVLGAVLLMLCAEGTRVALAQIAKPITQTVDPKKTVLESKPSIGETTQSSGEPSQTAAKPAISPEAPTNAPIFQLSSVGVNSQVAYNQDTGKTSVTNRGVVRFQDMAVEADLIELDHKTGDLIATGNVRLERPGKTNTAARIELNIFSNEPPRMLEWPMVIRNEKKQAILNKLNQIRLERITFDAMPLSNVVLAITAEAQRLDPEGRGVRIVINSNVNSPEDGRPVDISASKVTITSPLTNVRLMDALNAILKCADKPLKLSIEEYSVVISLKGQEPTPLLMREFKVEPTAFALWLTEKGFAPEKSTGATNSTHIAESIRNCLANAGINLLPMQGKSIFYNDRLGVLLVRATTEELDRVEAFLWSFQSPATRANGIALPPPVSSGLSLRTFKVDPNTFWKNLENSAMAPITRTNASKAIRDFFANLSMDLSPPKSFLFNDRAGELLVRSTKEDLDVIEAALVLLNKDAPQVNIKARFVEIDATGNNGASDLLLGSIPTNPSTASKQSGRAPGKIDSSNSSARNPSLEFTGILTEPQYRMVLRALEQRKGVDVLAMQEVTTLSGRQAQMQTVEIRTVINGLGLPVQPLPGNTSSNTSTNSLYQTQQMPFGPMLDVLPTVSVDGLTIEMAVTPALTEFLGYDDPDRVRSLPKADDKDSVILPLPRMRVRQMTAKAKIWDGQTLVLGMANDQLISKQSNGKFLKLEYAAAKKKQLLIFITPTIIDQAGNRAHAQLEAQPGRPQSSRN